MADRVALARRAGGAASGGSKDVLGRVLRRAGGVISTLRARGRDQHTSTYLPLEATPGPLRPRLVLPPSTALRPHATGLSRLSALYLAHHFDILGSGWVEVRHGMDCAGLEGLRYESGPSVQADVEGDWLLGRIPSASLPEAQRIWRLIEPGYVPIDWQLDLKSGWRWSELTWSRDLAYGRVPGADVKVPWEVARMQHLPQLALAASLAGSGTDRFEPAKRYIEAFRSQVLDFIATNPPRFGVNWTTTMDVAIRVVNWLAAYDLFRSGGTIFDEAFEAVFRRSVLEHGLHIVNNLEWHPTRRGNHYLADVAGLLFVAAHLGRDPERDAWFAFARSAVVAEASRQLQADGSGFEASTCYHRLTAEILTYSAALLIGTRDEDVAVAAPPYSLPASILERLEAAAEFTVDLTKPTGSIVQIGDNDSGRFIKLLPSLIEGRPQPAEDHLDHRHLVASISGLVDRPDLEDFCRPWAAESEIVRALARRHPTTAVVDAPEWRARTVTLTRPNEAIQTDDWWQRQPERIRGSLVIPIPGGRAREGLRQLAYPDFGVYIFRSDRIFLSVRCGSVGQDGVGGHAHNDQFAIELAVDGVDWIRDPGSYLYTPLPVRRNEYRSIRAHYAPAPGANEPARLSVSLFELGPGTDARCESWGPPGFAGRAIFSGAREVISRVRLTDDEVIIDYAFRGCERDPRLTEDRDWRRLLSPIRFSTGYGQLEDRG